MRVCRVLPDVSAVERAFDYLVPDELVPTVSVGTVVRVVLHGRRVRGWVLALDVEPDVDPAKLRPVLQVVSAGPPAAVVDLAHEVAYRWAGPLGAVLRSASPANNVDPASLRPPDAEVQLPALDAATDDVARAADALGTDAAGRASSVVRWPPQSDRRRLVARLLAPAGSTVVVTADGTRAQAFAHWLSSHGVACALLHSDLSAAIRTDAWRRAAGGRCVVVGGRMAVLAPVPDLAAIIVLDDGDEALQEERSPTWHTRDVARLRALACGARTVVVSPAPTVHALHDGGPLLVPPRSVERAGWPRVDVVDQRDQPPGTGLLTDALVDAVRSALDHDSSAVLVMNRRGGVRLLRCDACHQLTRWDAAGRPIWDDSAPDSDVEVRPTFCIHCGGQRLRVLSGGVQRLAEHLAARLAGREVAVVDTTVATAPEAPVLVGTEAVLHRREVRRRRPSLVAFVDFDAELYAARARAAEQALWQGVRAAHLLAGAPRGSARLLIQTHEPDHDVVRALLEADPGLLADAERERRRTYGLPPYSALAQLRGDSAVLDAAAAVLDGLEHQAAGVRADRDGDRLLVRAPDAVTLAAALAATQQAVRPVGPLRCAVDPQRL